MFVFIVIVIMDVEQWWTIIIVIIVMTMTIVMIMWLNIGRGGGRFCLHYQNRRQLFTLLVLSFVYIIVYIIKPTNDDIVYIIVFVIVIIVIIVIIIVHVKAVDPLSDVCFGVGTHAVKPWMLISHPMIHRGGGQLACVCLLASLAACSPEDPWKSTLPWSASGLQSTTQGSPSGP